MTWNYRIFTQISPTETTYQIYEVYYDEQDNIQFVSGNPQGPYGETLEEITSDLEHMRQALDLPILDMDEVLKILKESGAADHDKWFREQVKEGIREANDPNTVWVSHEDVVRDMHRQREAIRARIAGNNKETEKKGGKPCQ